MANLISENVEKIILIIRGQKVILDSDLSSLYGVSTKRLNEQVRRNILRFPDDFMFKLTVEEALHLRSHFATSSLLKNHGGRRTLPSVFTEHGAVMAANVLNSDRAINASIHIVRTFIKMRNIFTAHRDLDKKLGDLERRIGTHDKAIRSLFDTIREMMVSPDSNKQKIGFLRR